LKSVCPVMATATASTDRADSVRALW
jgi:hypothetical protein